MKNPQRDSLDAAEREIRAENEHLARYFSALRKGSPPRSDLPPALKAKADALVAKHAKKL